MIRIDRADRDHTELLDPANWLSFHWSNATRECRGCEDCGGSTETLIRCYGETMVDDVRHGVSVCRDEDDLVDYLAAVGADLDNCVLVKLSGPYSDDDAHDEDLGEYLILPTEITSVRPVDEAFVAQVFAKIDEKAA
ncbi:hypothetical protein ABZ234_03575 [Nocardiopsis sp. NPDC006198]|uniref:hypothetical protein n=1 Tax=Nocardiopsis sp. NPDC006198 TaxID=3154472 RepID=UPI0033B303BC